MTRKDYVAAARIFAEELKARNKEQGAALIYTAHKFADMFSSDNARFDRARFLKACGVQS